MGAIALPNVTVTTTNNPYAAAQFMRCDSRSDFEYVAREQLSARGFGRLRQDAGATMALARQLEHVFTKVYRAEFAQYRAHEFFPTDKEVEPGALTFTYRMVERIGNAQVISTSGQARDLPNVDVAAQEWQSPVITLGDSYDFSVINQASGAMMQIAIEAEKAVAAREAIEALEEQVYALGYAASGVPGVTNAPGVAAVTQVSTGTWTAQLIAGLASGPLSSAVCTAIASDLIACKSAIFTKTIARHRATNCLLPHNLHQALEDAPQSPLFNGKTMLTWLEEVTGLDIDYWPILLNAGSVAGSPLSFGAISGTNAQQNTRVLVYEKNPEVMQLIEAQPFTQLAPQPTGLMWQVPCYSRIGGAMAVRPLGFVYMDGL